MKATIDRDGFLVLIPESVIEQFAIMVWEEEQINNMTHPDSLYIIVREYEDGKQDSK